MIESQRKKWWNKNKNKFITKDQRRKEETDKWKSNVKKASKIEIEDKL